MNDLKLLLFDGDCLMCNESVRFIVKHDDRGIFKIGTLQSNIGESYLESYQVDEAPLTTLVYIKGDRALSKTTAVLEIMKDLGGFWQIFYILKIFPAFIRDPFYKLVSRNRFKWFGTAESCIVNDADFKSRVITEMAKSSHK